MDAEDPPKWVKRPVDMGNLLWTAKIAGTLLSVKTSLIDCSVKMGGKRGHIKGFSRAARLRMLKIVATIDWPQIKCGVFVTLTWPCETFHLYEKLRNQARDQFIRDLEKYLGKKIHVLWRIEWKRRKKGRYRGKFLPHFHLIIPNVRYIPKEWVRDKWKQCVQAKWRAITWIDKLEEEGKHAIYIAKYCAKAPSESVLDHVAYLNTPGRHWGQHRPGLLPQHQPIEFMDLRADVVQRLRDLATANLGYYDQQFDSGFCVFGQKGKKAVEAALKILLDTGEAKE